MPIKLRPLSDRLVVKVDDAATMSDHGIYIPDVAQEKPQIGTVLWAGPGKVSEFPVITDQLTNQILDRVEIRAEFKRMPMIIEEGDRVLFGKFSGAEVQVERENFLIIRQSDVLCLLVSEDEQSD